MNFHLDFDWHQPPTFGELRILKNINEVRQLDQNDVDQIGLCQKPFPGTCSGVTQWIAVDSSIKQLIRRINPTQTWWDGAVYTTDDKIHWAVWERTGGLMYAPSGNRDSNDDWWEFSIAIGSKDRQTYNTVRVLEYNGGYAKIARLPVLPDYTPYSPQDTPEFFHRVFCTTASGNVNESPKGTFYMPILSPEGRPHAVGDNGGWIPDEYLV